jgi:hypothetical protein
MLIVAMGVLFVVFVALMSSVFAAKEPRQQAFITVKVFLYV